jgi:hypothetical protein
MLNRDGAELHAINPHPPKQSYHTPVGHWQVPKQFPGYLGRIDRTWGALGEACSVVVVCMCKDNRCRGKDAETMEPVGAAVDHDPGVTLLNQQRAVPAMPSRPDCRLAARAKKCKLHFFCLGASKPDCYGTARLRWARQRTDDFL